MHIFCIFKIGFSSLYYKYNSMVTSKNTQHNQKWPAGYFISKEEILPTAIPALIKIDLFVVTWDFSPRGIQYPNYMLNNLYYNKKYNFIKRFFFTPIFFLDDIQRPLSVTSFLGQERLSHHKHQIESQWPETVGCIGPFSVFQSWLRGWTGVGDSTLSTCKCTRDRSPK